MTTGRLLVCLSQLAVAALFAVSAGAAERAMTLKIATVAPKGSIYHRVLQDIGQKWRDAQGGRSRFIVYTNSVQGPEPETVRRMRVGQLNASMVSIVGLSQIDKAVGVLQFMPLIFRTWEEVDYVREKLRPELEERLRAKGFTVLFWGEGGWVQFFSNEPRMMPEDYKSAKIFAWAGNNAQVDIMKSLGYRPVVMELTDILPSLQTGMIDTVPAAPLWALAAQFDRTAPYMLRINWVPIVGAVIMTTKTLDAMSPAARAALLAAGEEAGEKLRQHRNKQDEDIVRALESRGLKVLTLTPEVERAWQELARRAWPGVRGGMVPADMFDNVGLLLAEFRGEKK
ncbi:MAG: TRAP transporter substrate-binding protein DctP [Betaproteobacteria bacterium]|nr:TRAP transporter substrate-binding protein DctP [Betaproteobacteria bacterium]MDH3437912.1 TRAP transporter substrate-binding protein DctP [Betaproteobacteria bacterium]